MNKAYRKTLGLSGLYAFGNLARRGLHVVLLPVYTAYLGREDWGTLALLAVTGAVLSVLVVTPLVSGGLSRFYYHPDYRKKQGALLWNTALLLLVMAAVLGGIWWLCAGKIARALLGNAELRGLVRLYGLVLVLLPISELAVQFVKLRGMARYFVFLCLGECVVAAGTVVVALAVLKLGVAAAVWGYVAAAGFTSLACIPVLLRYCAFRFSPGVLREPLKFGFPMLPTGLSRLVMQLGDRYVLRIFAPMSAVGLYAFGYGVAEGIDTAIGTPAYDAVNPTIRKLEADPEAQKRFIRATATMFYLLITLLALMVALFSKEVVMLLARQKEYWECWVVIPVLALAFTQQFLGSFLDWGMIMKNKPHYLSGVLMVSAGVNIGLNFALIPSFGMMGAAVATMCSYLVWNVLRGYFSAKFYGLRLEFWRLGQVTVLAVGVYGLSLVIVSGANLWVNIGVKLALAAAFPALCYVTGVLTKEEKGLLHGFLRRIRTEGLVSVLRDRQAAGKDGIE